ncbi:type II toxin-antitoxin system PemK/MazF family toxin [Marinomonas fungiae]|uniref:type II toxin-antitoxin system PemK/MazF family toxin n=1 Tax=Marinomonas fungiae TaxID=1137284 RepID=UPI003A95A554
MVKRGEVYWVELDPTVGSEIRKTRPCLVISPDDMNQALPRVIIAPTNTKGQPLGCHPEITLDGKPSRILLDQICTVDKKHLKSQLGTLPLEQWNDTLLQMLA